MAAFERSTATSVSATPATLALVRREPAEPMQRAIDGWYRDQPEAFARTAETSAAGDPASTADRAIALNHLLAYGRLAAEQDLVALRERAGKDGSPVLAPLLRQVGMRNAELLSRAPTELRPALGVGFAATQSALKQKAAAIDALTVDRRRATALEQSIQLGESMLRKDPEQYETVVADAEAMADGLRLEARRHQSLIDSLGKRLATAALEGHLDPVAGDPGHAEQDLARGRFRDAFDTDGIKAWRDLVAFQQKRRSVQETLATRDAGIVAELKMLSRLATAGRGEAPMPAPAEVEAVFSGEGEQRLAAAEHERKRRLYAEQIALQPFDRDQAWIAAGESDDDTQLRRVVVWEKHKQFAKSGGNGLLEQSPELTAAIEAGIEDPSKLNLAIDLYQWQLTKLGVPPRWVRQLPDEALRSIARQYHNLDTAADKREWLRRLAVGVGEERAESLLIALSGGRDLLPRGIAALAKIVTVPGNEAQVEAAIARLDHAQIAELSRIAVDLEDDPIAAEAALGEVVPLRSDELERLTSVDPTGPEFRAFVAQAREAEASPHGLGLFARGHGLHPERLRLVLEIADVNAATPKTTIAELNHRLMVQMPAVDADQGYLGTDLYKLEERASVSEETRLRTIQELLVFATIRDPRDSEIYKQVVDAAMGMSHAIGPSALPSASIGLRPRWAPRNPVEEPWTPLARSSQPVAKPAPSPPARQRLGSPVDRDPNEELAARVWSLHGTDVENHPDAQIRQYHQDLIALMRENDTTIGRLIGKLVPNWRSLIPGMNRREGGINQMIVRRLLAVENIPWVAGGRRFYAPDEYYVPDNVLRNRLGVEGAILDAKHSRTGKWRLSQNQRPGMANDRNQGLNTFGSGVKDGHIVVKQIE